MRNMRHVVNVMAPPPPTSESQVNAVPLVFMRDVPCSIKTLSGQEAERMAQMYGAATLKVEMYGSPTKPIKTIYWLKFGERKLNVMGIIDKQQNGEVLELICGEEVA